MEFHNAAFKVLGEYRNYYAGYEPLSFTGITPGSIDNYGLQLVFDSNLPDLRHIECAEEGADPRVLENNTLFVPLDRELDVVQEKFYQLRPIFSSSGSEHIYKIRIHCMTIKAFEKAGGMRTRDIVKITSEPAISFGTNKPENWKSFQPSESDVAFANKQWGHLVEGVSSEFEKARILTKALNRELKPHQGMPMAFIYGLPTLEKYLAITSGKSGHACGQYSEIFSMACNCFGVINRHGFLQDGLLNDEMFIELGSSHLVTEVFDRELNQWIFIDGRFNTLGAYLGTVGPLTLQEFMLFINQPNRRKHLNILHYDVEEDQEELMPLDHARKRFSCYLGWTKEFQTRYSHL